MSAKAVAAMKEALDGLERSVASVSCETASDEHPVLANLPELERKLALRGWPRISEWWLNVIRDFYSAPYRRIVCRVGRRGGKSTTWCRIAVLEALYGQHAIPPGDVGVVPIISVDRREAGRRLRTIRQILDALGVGYSPIDGGIQLAHKPIAFQVFTASIAGVSGFTSIFVFCDEVAKWKDADTGANPATEVLASLRPTMKTQKNARMVLSSSPMGILDAHADAFAVGNDNAQRVCYAPTWVANPTITEAETHAEEPDELLWRREYAAIPLEDFETSVLTTAILDLCQRAAGDLPPEHGWSYIATTDPATRGNGWTLIVRTTDMVGRRIIVLSFEWRGTPSKPLDPEDVFREMAVKLRPYGVKHVHQDMHSFDANASIARRHELTLIPFTATNIQKTEMYDTVRTLMVDGKVETPPDKMVRADLLGVRKRLTAGGYTIILAEQNGRHSDFAPSVAMALTMHCAQPKLLPQGPTEQVEADALQRDIEAWRKKRGLDKHGRKKRRWWEEAA